MTVMVGAQIVVLIGVCLLVGGVLSARLHIAAPVVLILLGGVAGGVLEALPGGHSVALPSEVVLLLFLPVLLYWESITTSLREITADLRSIALRAVVLVLLTAAGIAAVGHAVGLSWPVAFVLGAVLAPTDATAVAAVAGRLPRRTLTTLRAESLINDGTALVIYALAVEAATGARHVGLGEIAWRLPLSYAGGLLIGLTTALVVLVVLRVLHEPRQKNVLSVMIPFLAYLPAEELGLSGVVSVVSCGLLLSQATPRVIEARTRAQAQGFWQLTTHILNGALFVLIGLQLWPVLSGSDLSLGAALRDVLLVTLVVVGTRLVWMNTVPYVVKALDRRPAQQLRWVGARQRFPVAWAGFRGAVSLAAALALPEDVVGRDRIVLITFAVILATLLVQGLTMPAVVRWARLPADPGEQDEHQLVERQMSSAALAALDQRAAELGSPPDAVTRVRTFYLSHLTRLESQGEEGTRQDQEGEDRLHLALLVDKRAAIVRLRDTRRIDDTVLRWGQVRLDAEELRLSEPAQEE
ncbi:Na+/H+ antiporter [Micromonosporaceae bacterium Da 78-11]